MQCPSVHTLPPVHPSILPSISALAGHSHFAKQSSFPFITSSSPLLLFYQPVLFLDASFFFKPFDSNWFLSRPLIRTPFVLYPSSSSLSLSLSLSHSRSFSLSFPLFLSLSAPPSRFSLHRTQVRARICSPVMFRPDQRTFLFLATSGKEVARGRARGRKTHDDRPRVELPEHRADSYTRECARCDSEKNR